MPHSFLIVIFKKRGHCRLLNGYYYKIIGYKEDELPKKIYIKLVCELQQQDTESITLQSMNTIAVVMEIW